MLLSALIFDMPVLRQFISTIAPVVSAETKSDPPRAWRIDTRVTEKDRDANTISNWIQNLQEVDACPLHSLVNLSVPVLIFFSAHFITPFAYAVQYQQDCDGSPESPDRDPLMVLPEALSQMYVTLSIKLKESSEFFGSVLQMRHLQIFPFCKYRRIS